MPIKRSVLFVLLALVYLTEPLCQASTSTNGTKERGTLYEIADSKSTDPAKNDKYFGGVIYSNYSGVPDVTGSPNVFLISQLEKFALPTKIPLALSNCVPDHYLCTGWLFVWVAISTAPPQYYPNSSRWCGVSSNRFMKDANGNFITNADGDKFPNNDYGKYCVKRISAMTENFTCDTKDDCVIQAKEYAPVSCKAGVENFGNSCCTPSPLQKCDVCNSVFGLTNCKKQILCGSYSNGSYRMCSQDEMSCEYYKDEIKNCKQNTSIPLLTGYANFIRIPNSYIEKHPMDLPYPFAKRTLLAGDSSAWLHEVPLEASCRKKFTAQNTATNSSEILDLNPKAISKGFAGVGLLDTRGVAKIWASFMEVEQTTTDKYGVTNSQFFINNPKILFDGNKTQVPTQDPTDVAKTGDSGNDLLKCSYQDGCFIWGSSLVNTDYQDKLLFLKNNLGYPQKDIYTNVTCKSGFLSSRDPDSISVELRCGIVSSLGVKSFNKSIQADSERCVTGCWVRDSGNDNKFANTTFENKDFVGVYANQSRDVACKDGYEVELDGAEDLDQMTCPNGLDNPPYSNIKQECKSVSYVDIPRYIVNYSPVIIAIGVAFAAAIITGGVSMLGVAAGVTASITGLVAAINNPTKVTFNFPVSYNINNKAEKEIRKCHTQVQCVAWDYLLKSEYGNFTAWRNSLSIGAPEASLEYILSLGSYTLNVANYNICFFSIADTFIKEGFPDESQFKGSGSMLTCRGLLSDNDSIIPYYPDQELTSKCELGRYYQFNEAMSLWLTYIPEAHYREICEIERGSVIDTEIKYYGYKDNDLGSCQNHYKTDLFGSTKDLSGKYYDIGYTCDKPLQYTINKLKKVDVSQYSPTLLHEEGYTSDSLTKPKQTSFSLSCKYDFNSKSYEVIGYKKCVPSYCYLPEDQGYKKTKYSNSRVWQNVDCMDGRSIIRQPDGPGTDYIFENGFKTKCYNGTLSYQRIDGTSITPDEASTYKCESICKLDSVAKDKTMKTIFKGNYINDTKATPSSGTCDSNGKVTPQDSGICIADQVTNTYRFLPCDKDGNPKVANSGICLKNSRGVYDFAPSIVVDKNLFLREGQFLNVKCTDSNNNEYNSYNATCNSSSSFNGLIGCTQTNLTCGGKTNIFYATKITESKSLAEGSSYDINCGEGYYSGFVGSDKTTMTFKCLNNTLYFVTPSGFLSTSLPQCTRKCQLKGLLQYGDVKARFDDKSVIILPTMKDLIEPMTKPTITCNSLIGEEWGFIDSNGNPSKSLKTVCGSTGDYQTLGFSGVAKCVNLGCKNSEILFMNSFKNPVPKSYRDGVTNNLKQIECPFGYRRIANGFKLAVCIAGTWKGDKAIECIIDPASPESRKPQLGASVNKYLTVKVRNNIIPNATLSGGEVIEDSSKVKILNLQEGQSVQANCNPGYSFYIDQSTVVSSKIFVVKNGKLGITPTDRCLKLVSIDRLTKSDAKVVVSVSGSTTKLAKGSMIKPGTELKVECDNTGQATNDALGIVGVAATSYTTKALENGMFSAEFGESGKVCVTDYKQCSVENLTTLIDFNSIDQAKFTATTSGKFYIPNQSIVPLVAKIGFGGPLIPKCIDGFWDRGPKTIGSTTTTVLNQKPYRAFANCSSDAFEGYYADNGKKFNKDIVPYNGAKKTFKDGESIFLKCGREGYEFTNDSMDCPEATGLSGTCGTSTCVNGSWSNDVRCMTWIPIDMTYQQDSSDGDPFSVVKKLNVKSVIGIDSNNLYLAKYSRDKYGNDLNSEPLNYRTYYIFGGNKQKLPMFGSYSVVFDSPYADDGWGDTYGRQYACPDYVNKKCGQRVVPSIFIDFGASNQVLTNLKLDYPNDVKYYNDRLEISTDLLNQKLNLRCDNGSAYLVYRVHHARYLSSNNGYCDDERMERKFKFYYIPVSLKGSDSEQSFTLTAVSDIDFSNFKVKLSAEMADRNYYNGKFLGVQCIKDNAPPMFLYSAVYLEENTYGGSDTYAAAAVAYCDGPGCESDSCGENNFN